MSPLVETDLQAQTLQLIRPLPSSMPLSLPLRLPSHSLQPDLRRRRHRPILRLRLYRSRLHFRSLTSLVIVASGRASNMKSTSIALHAILTFVFDVTEVVEVATIGLALVMQHWRGLTHRILVVEQANKLSFHICSSVGSTGNLQLTRSSQKTQIIMRRPAPILLPGCKKGTSAMHVGTSPILASGLATFATMASGDFATPVLPLIIAAHTHYSQSLTRTLHQAPHSKCNPSTRSPTILMRLRVTALHQVPPLQQINHLALNQIMSSSQSLPTATSALNQFHLLRPAITVLLTLRLLLRVRRALATTMCARLAIITSSR